MKNKPVNNPVGRDFGNKRSTGKIASQNSKSVTKKIKPLLSRMPNQFVFKLDGVEYDIIDLTKDQYCNDVEHNQFYKPYNYQLYDGTDTAVFKSINEAIQAVVDGTYKDK